MFSIFRKTADALAGHTTTLMQQERDFESYAYALAFANGVDEALATAVEAGASPEVINALENHVVRADLIVSNRQRVLDRYTGVDDVA